ncbi:MAG TPA: carboxypeptidase-like regulatory domain-containing protein, partial [Puia sp.]|nr:carboxypeptidase-like regulatory domain-containing protein [Puia sp.]
MNRSLLLIGFFLSLFTSLSGVAAPFPSDSLPAHLSDSIPAHALPTGNSGPAEHLLPGPGPGTGSLSGRITDKAGTPMSGASIYIPDLKMGVVADSAGYYHFNSLPSGKYLVEAHYVGYKTFTKSVTVSGPVTADFLLSDEYVEESPVVVTGLSKATQIKRNPVP